MPEYYYEYCVPNQESYDPQEARKNKTDPKEYKVVQCNVVYSQHENIAEQQIKSEIKNINPSYSDGFGIMMFTELPEDETKQSFCFSNKDWKERLQRSVSNPEETIIIDLDD